MPIYEYHCLPCNRVFSFFSHRVNPEPPPACPKCGGTGLKKVLSRFAVVGATPKSAAAPGGEAPPAGTPDQALDDPRVAGEMEKLMTAAEGLDENDPRQLGRLMRRMAELTGETNPELQTAIRRLEQGEDPETIEADMGDVLGGAAAGGAAPEIDDGLYPMGD